MVGRSGVSSPHLRDPPWGLSPPGGVCGRIPSAQSEKHATSTTHPALSRVRSRLSQNELCVVKSLLPHGGFFIYQRYDPGWYLTRFLAPLADPPYPPPKTQPKSANTAPGALWGGGFLAFYFRTPCCPFWPFLVLSRFNVIGRFL